MMAPFSIKLLGLKIAFLLCNDHETKKEKGKKWNRETTSENEQAMTNSSGGERVLSNIV